MKTFHKNKLLFFLILFELAGESVSVYANVCTCAVAKRAMFAFKIAPTTHLKP